MNNLVSIVMNCYNSELYLREAIDSILMQSYKNFELIICNNQSTDSTLQIINSYEDTRIRLVHTASHCPLGEARNHAIGYCNGDFIAFIDSDDIWLSEKLKHQIERFKKNKEIEFIYTNYYFLRQINNKKFKKKIAFRRLQPKGFIFQDVVTSYKIAISSVIFKASILVKIKYLFNKEFQQIEEFDLFTRILYNHQADYIAIPLCCYRIHNKMNTIVNPQWGTKEYKKLLSSYLEMDPNFLIKNSKIVYFIRAKYLSYATAKYDLLYGNYEDVRKSLKNYVTYDLKNLIVFILSFFPKEFVRKIVG